MKKTVIRFFEKVEDSPFDILNKFRNILINIGCWKEEMGENLKDPKWEVSETGIQWDWNYLDFDDPVLSNFTGLYIQATAVPFPLNMSRSPFTGGIICTISLNFTNQFNKFDLNNYLIINEISLLIFNEFISRPVILLMDETKKISPYSWEPVELSNYKRFLNPWNFDYAILPRNLNDIYETIPKTHIVKKHEGYTETWRVSKWKKEVLDLKH